MTAATPVTAEMIAEKGTSAEIEPSEDFMARMTPGDAQLSHEAYPASGPGSLADKRGIGDPRKGEYNAFLGDDGSGIPCD